MADPQAGLSLGDWFAAVVASAIAGIGGAMAWFVGSRNKLQARMDAQDEKMDLHTAKHYSHETQLAVIHTNQDHMSERLDEIRECTQTTNEKLSALSDTLMKVLVEVKKP